jgi:hypothetical protein
VQLAQSGNDGLRCDPAVKSEIDKWTKPIKAAGVSAD